jgi:hypothetical protein
LRGEETRPLATVGDCQFGNPVAAAVDLQSGVQNFGVPVQWVLPVAS